MYKLHIEKSTPNPACTYFAGNRSLWFTYGNLCRNPWSVSLGDTL